MRLPDHFFANRRLDLMVENKTSYTIDNAELNIYETHHFAEQVLLKFSQPVLASMLEGKKVMHLGDKTPFSFLPGESLCLPADELMCIDFPEAKENNPTRCLAMQIDQQLVNQVIQEMNEQMPRTDREVWSVSDENYAFTNDQAIHQLLQRLIFVFMENHPSKELFIQLMMKELIIRIRQTENKDHYLKNLISISSSNRMAFTIQYIQEHIDETLSVPLLAAKANMSEPNFHRVFKNELGMSPITFINETRVKKAMALLRNPEIQMKEVFMACGFSDASYFNRIFKKALGVSPKAYQQQLG